MKEKETFIRRGVVAEFEGKFWGVQYEDGHSTTCGFGPINNAAISDPKYCKHPEDMTYADSHYLKQLVNATLRKVIRTTTYEIEGG